MDIKNFYEKYRFKLIFGIVSFLILLLIVGSIFLPSIFYDQFIWRYFWGPIVSDSLGYPISYNGIQAEDKYTIISELIYGLLISLCCLLCWSF